jgi:hypothetical protein
VLSDALRVHGHEGLKLAENQILEMMDGKRASLDFADLRTSHLLLAELEKRAEMDQAAMKAHLARVGQTLAVIGGGILKALIPAK